MADVWRRCSPGLPGRTTGRGFRLSCSFRRSVTASVPLSSLHLTWCAPGAVSSPQLGKRLAMSEIRTERQACAARSEPRFRELVRPEESGRSGVEAGRLSRRDGTTPGRIDNRHRSSAKLLAHCPFCGQKHVAMLVSETKKAEDALCTSRCADAWHALSALRGRESENRPLAARLPTPPRGGGARGPESASPRFSAA